MNPHTNDNPDPLSVAGCKVPAGSRVVVNSPNLITDPDMLDAGAWELGLIDDPYIPAPRDIPPTIWERIAAAKLYLEEDDVD